MAPVRKGKQEKSRVDGRTRCGPSDPDCKGEGTGKVVKPRKKRTGPPNPFILFLVDTIKREGGNMYCMAKVCGKRWRNMSDKEKGKWKAKYCRLCKACRSCKKPSGGKGKNGDGKGGKNC